MYHLENGFLEKYLESIRARLMAHFDLYENYNVSGERFDLYGYHKNNFFKSFLTKHTVYEGYSVFEHILVRIVDNADKEETAKFQELLKNLTPSLSNPDKFHKKSIITGILVSKNTISDSDLIKGINKFFYRKTYKMSFHGWSETQMALVSLKDKANFIPKHRKDLKNLLAF